MSSNVMADRIAELEALQKMAKLKDGLPHLYGLKMYEWQDEFFHTWEKTMLLTAANQIGKAQSINESIPTQNGFVRMGDINIGDMVIGEDGKPRRVNGIPFRGVSGFYKITFDDGATVEASGNHLWKCQAYANRFRPTYRYGRGKNTGDLFANKRYGKWEVHSTKDIIDQWYSNGKVTNANKVAIPVCQPVEYATERLEYDAYTIGAMIGDGDCCNVTISVGDSEILERMGLTWTRPASRPEYMVARPKIKEQLEELGLYGKKSDSKFIPKQFLTAPLEQRIDLLRGLMDTDGSAYKSTLEYCTVSKHLADDIVELINSLGGIVNSVSTKKPFYYDTNGEKVMCLDAYSVRFKIQINPFYIERKANRWVRDIRYKHQRLIESIEYIGEKECQCLSVDGELYLSGRNYVVTHNSSIQIRKYIDFCTRPDLWRKLFPAKLEVDPNAKPFLWYLYPNQDTVMQEFDEKWEKEFMPRGEFKDHPIYGWRKVIKNKVLKAIQFNSGAAIYFKTYSQDVADLQAGTCWIIGCDEELPVNHYSELIARLFASDGFFSMVFTATLGQDYWRRAMEPTKTEKEELVGAWKRQISVYDCKFYADGSASHWTDERIERNISKCKSKAEVLRRIFGRFVKDDNVMYHCFNRDSHYVQYPQHNGVEYRGVPKGWEVYSGVDIGGGGDSHPAAFTFISVNKERTKVRVFKGKRLDGIGNTTALDVLMHYQGVRDGMKLKPNSQAYDWGSKDFKTLADRSGESFVSANKERDAGVDIINSLFKYNILKIYQSEEHDKLAEELESLSAATAKSNAKDDFIDSMRYAIMSAPIDWAKIIEQIEEGKLHVSDNGEERKVTNEREDRADWWKEHKETVNEWDRAAEAEMSFWGSLY